MAAGILSGREFHDFDTGAVGDLNFPPVVASVLETTMPVQAEAEQVPVETIFGRAVLDDEASVQHARAELSGGGVGPSERVKLHEGDGIAFGVAQREIRDRVDVPGDGANRDVMGKEVGAHPAKVGCGKRDFEKKVWGWSSRCFRQ